MTITASIARVRRYVEMRDAKPMRQLDDVIHGIHGGTEWEAELRLSDLRNVLAGLDNYAKTIEAMVS